LLKFSALLLIILISLSYSHYAQTTHILKPNGKLYNFSDESRYQKLNETHESVVSYAESNTDSNSIKNVVNITGVTDTLGYTRYGNFNTNFGFHSQDVMMQYFIAPSDMTIQGIGFSCSDDSGRVNGADISVRFVKLNWTWDQLTEITAGTNLGYYPSEGDGYGNTDYFGKNATGDWIDSTNGLYPLPAWDHDEYDIWSDSGKGISIVPVKQDSAGNYQWIETSIMGLEPTILLGSVFAVVLEHNGFNINEDEIGFWASDEVGFPGWKYTEGSGWLVSSFTWDFAVAIDLPSRPPYRFSNVTQLNTTLSTESRIVEAELWSDPGVFTEINLVYSINNGIDQIRVPMDSLGNSRYSAEIPGQQPGTEVYYYCEAIDWEGNILDSYQQYVYSIFSPTLNVNTLLIFHRQYNSIYPSLYYFGQDDFIDYTTVDFPHDIWEYGEFDSSLINNYQNIFEFTTAGPDYYHTYIIGKWLNEDGNRNYFLAGDEWLGMQNWFNDSTYSPGTFEYDNLGIANSYNDVSYADSTGDDLPSKLEPVQGSLIGGELYNLFMVNGPTDSLRYDPIGELGVRSNWIDGFEPVNPDNVDLMVETRGIGGVPKVEIKPCAVHNITENGNRIVFLSYDPISINSSPEYYWYGFSKSSLQVQTLDWFGILTDQNEGQNSSIPNKYELYQNYPNPFNPSTTIKYSVPALETGLILSLKIIVYDIIGREVAVLVDQKQKPGTYELEFHGNQLSSGVYICQFRAENFIESKKMLLIK
jgi:Secretion system C-terminal sorting domain